MIDSKGFFINEQMKYVINFYHLKAEDQTAFPIDLGFLSCPTCSLKFPKLESQFTLIAFVGCVFLDSSLFGSDHFADLKKLLECCFYDYKCTTLYIRPVYISHG